MKRVFAQLRSFSQDLDQLIAENKLLVDDFEEFERELLEDPEKGTVIPGLHGLRKTRIKSSTKGKRGGFRIDYLNIEERELIILVVIYSKNKKSDLSSDEKKIIEKKVLKIKEEVKRTRLK